MTKAELLKRARRKYKGHGHVDRIEARHDPRGCDAAGRAYAHTRFKQLVKPTRKPLCDECAKNGKEHRAAFREFEKQEAHWRHRGFSYRFKLYTIMRTGMGDMASGVGEGDSWDEVAESAELQ